MHQLVCCGIGKVCEGEEEDKFVTEKERGEDGGKEKMVMGNGDSSCVIERHTKRKKKDQAYKWNTGLTGW